MFHLVLVPFQGCSLIIGIPPYMEESFLFLWIWLVATWRAPVKTVLSFYQLLRDGGVLICQLKEGWCCIQNNVIIVRQDKIFECSSSMRKC